VRCFESPSYKVLPRQMPFRIERAAITHIDAICAIERAAVELFRGHVAWPLYSAVSIPPEQLAEEIRRGLVWVALDSDSNEPVGFVWLDTEQGGSVVGIAEIDVLPAYGRRGIGAALLEHACTWARAAGYRRMDLGTLADVPWNAPFYARHGFDVVDKHDPAFAYARDRDRENGFPDSLRVFMSRKLEAPAADEWTIWPAPAKLDLFPPNKPRRVIQLLDASDEVRLRARDDGMICVQPEFDSALRAAELLRKHAGIQAGADIDIDLRIPGGISVGRESSIAATVLVALNQIWRLGFNTDQLAEWADELGSDVPVFVRSRTVQATESGDGFRPIKLPQRWYVLLDPHECMSTAELFPSTDELTRSGPPATISFFASGETLEDVFEPIARSRYPRVAAAWDWLEGHGHARFSGSGGCVFLETATPERAEAVARRCPAAFTAWMAEGVGLSPLRRALVRHAATD
jgi:4-diphosphocytidyl-2-C-methyl-D-erythritol kinase